MEITEATIGTKVNDLWHKRTGVIIGHSRQGSNVIIVEWDKTLHVEAYNVEDLILYNPNKDCAKVLITIRTYDEYGVAKDYTWDREENVLATEEHYGRAKKTAERIIGIVKDTI